MATEAEIGVVRQNTNEPTQDNFTDATIGALVDSGDVDSASAAIWRMKAASYADLVDTTEAGTSHKFSDLHKNALMMAKQFGSVEPVKNARASVHKIVRS